MNKSDEFNNGYLEQINFEDQGDVHAGAYNNDIIYTFSTLNHHCKEIILHKRFILKYVSIWNSQ